MLVVVAVRLIPLAALVALVVEVLEALIMALLAQPTLAVEVAAAMEAQVLRRQAAPVS